MLVRFAVTGVAISFLAACGSQIPVTSARYNSSVFPSTKGPAYVISTVLPDAAKRPATSSTVSSLKAVTYVGGKRFISVVNASVACPITNTSGTATGCQVVVGSSKAFKIKRATFSFYKKAKAKGCVLATGKFAGGTTYQDEVLGVTFKATNTQSCW